MKTTPIIDYASPAPRKLRLPARSDIDIDEQPDRLTIRETLAGRQQAVFALAFAAFVIVAMGLIAYDLSRKWQRNAEVVVLIGGMMVTEAFVAALVINNTWRKTVLTVTPEEITLRFSAPFTASQRHHFAAEQIAAVLPVDRVPQEGAADVAELEIRMWSVPSVHLFAGHPPTLLSRLAGMITRAQSMSHSAAPNRTL